MKLNFMAEVEGGVDKMKDVTVAHLYIDTAYGREPLLAMRIIDENWGFRLLEIPIAAPGLRSEEHTSELQSLMRITYAVFCLEKKKITTPIPKQYNMMPTHNK